MSQEYPIRYLDPLPVTVDFEEVDEPSEGIDDTGRVYIDRTLQCDWGDRWRLAEQMRGTSKLIGGVCVVHAGQECPDYGDARCSSVDMNPFGSMTGADVNGYAEFSKARLRLRYTKPDSDEVDPELLVTETIQPTVEFLTVGTDGLYWDDDQKEPILEAEAPGRMVRGIDWVYTRHKVMRVPMAVLSLVGHCNKYTMTSLTTGLTFQPEELLYCPPVLDRDYTTAGAQAFRITMRFTYKPGGWNAFLRSGKTDPQRIYDAAGEIWRPYPLGDLLDLTG